MGVGGRARKRLARGLRAENGNARRLRSSGAALEHALRLRLRAGGRSRIGARVVDDRAFHAGLDGRLAHEQLDAHALSGLETQVRDAQGLVGRASRRIDRHGTYAREALDDGRAMVDRLHARVRQMYAPFGDNARIEAELALVEHVRHVPVRKRVDADHHAIDRGEARDGPRHDGKHGNVRPGFL